jgi:membrane AbrB-like protein
MTVNASGDRPEKQATRLRRALAMAATLALGTGSGWLFMHLGAPLPWMLGAMSACAAAAILGAPVQMPGGVRPFVLPLLGVVLGTNFTPKILSHVSGLALSLTAMGFVLIVASWAGMRYYARFAGFDRVTAFFSAMPGGLVDMAVMGEQAGGDIRKIALAHTARLAAIVAIVPFVVQIAEHVLLGPRQATPVTLADAPLSVYFWMVGVAAAGFWAGRLLKLPSYFLIGPLALSALVHGAGVTDFVVPRELVNGAQIVLGCATGCRFAGFAARQIVTTLAHAFAVNGLVIAFTCAVVWLISPMIGVGFTSLLLAMATGGISEMSLVALALHLDIAFVLIHQLVRLAAVVAIAPIAFRLFVGKRSEAKDQPPNLG